MISKQCRNIVLAIEHYSPSGNNGLLDDYVIQYEPWARAFTLLYWDVEHSSEHSMDEHTAKAPLTAASN